ncbi:hypothetical protein OK414_29495 [Priestia sp. JV24]|uniref:hypothetical protein n=1 Tax=Priestia TaxID=2800373 RepID=UPI0021D674AA|nr:MULTISPECIES: hypothetical protein [Priestia]MCU7713065.1 hypothetical protein [Priestia megaterium]MCW1049190.1 hypothetical protein [Priestia sp. JV24]
MSKQRIRKMLGDLRQEMERTPNKRATELELRIHEIIFKHLALVGEANGEYETGSEEYHEPTEPLTDEEQAIWEQYVKESGTDEQLKMYQSVFDDMSEGE